jgi:hypothetical protein
LFLRFLPVTASTQPASTSDPQDGHRQYLLATCRC